MSNHVLFIGAAGEMSKVAVNALATLAPDLKITLADLREEPVQELAREIGAHRARGIALDLYNSAALSAAMQEVDLVILGAGPFIRTAAPVLEVCISNRVPYLDFGDDVESTVATLAFDEQAKAAGIPAFIGCGASPGLTNVLALETSSHLDKVESIDIAWCSGDEGPSNLGPAVLEHLLLMVVGEAQSWRHGKPAMIPLGESAVFPMGGELGDLLLYEVKHPEPVTLPRRFPDIQNVRCFGAMHPLPSMGLMKGLAEGVHRGELAMPDAVAFLLEILSDGEGSEVGWRFALSGAWEQVRRGETTIEEFLNYLSVAASGVRQDWIGGMLVRASGMKDNKKTSVTRRLVTGDPNGWKSMAHITGSTTAAMAKLALAKKAVSGVISPEDWVEPNDLFAVLATMGVSREAIVEPYLEIRVDA